MLGNINFFKNTNNYCLKRIFLCRFNSSEAGAEGEIVDFTNTGEKLAVYSFLLAGDMVKDVAIKELDVCLEVTRTSLVPVFTIFKYHSSLKFDFLVDMVS